VWFNLGDRDLAIGLRRAEMLALGGRLTQALEELTGALELGARVLPMSDDPVRTWVLARGSWSPFQEFMILGRAQGPVDGVELRGAEAASAPPEVLDAIAAASAIVIGPSNPVISIGPILAVPGMREALEAAPAPVVAVSPLVAGRAVKGPTEAFLAWAGHARSAEGIAAAYAGLVDGLVCDEPCQALPALRTDVDLSTPAARRRVAEETLAFAAALGSRR
jgi:LPPG:FO 2-phospho-L-lactate transferase